MHIILIGMPGAGKSHTAKAVAKRLGWPVADLDWEVQKRAGMPIAALISAEGEPAFRVLEAEVLADALAESPLVIATGGGTPIQPGAMEALKKSGLVIYLKVDAELAQDRIKNDTQERLHLADDLPTQWAALYEARKAVYEQAHLICQDVEAVMAFVEASVATQPAG
jgi:shikimate kinase